MRDWFVFLVHRDRLSVFLVMEEGVRRSSVVKQRYKVFVGLFFCVDTGYLLRSSHTLKKRVPRMQPIINTNFCLTLCGCCSDLGDFLLF